MSSPRDAEGILPDLPNETDLSKIEKRWGLTLRRPSIQRKHAQHARHMPSRTLDVLGEEKINSSALLNATMKANRETVSHAETHAMNIVSHMEMDDELMLDDPISEQLRLEKLRDIPHCLTVKRAIKSRLTSSVNEKKKRKPIGFWKRLKYRISISFMKVNMALREVASTMEFWYYFIKAIEGHFGSGVATYFKFLRWLFTFNIICCILSVGFIVLPQSLIGVHSGGSFSGWDILTGAGVFTNSIMYYGFYTNGTISRGSGPLYSMPAAYFMTFLCCYVFTFLLLSIKVARSYRKSFIETAEGLTNVYASKIFCGWDFGIASHRAANLRSATIYGELTEILGENQKRSHQDCPIRCYALFIQTSITLLVITILSGTGVLLWTSLNKYARDYTNTYLIFVVPLSITIIMNVYPAFFSWLVQFEGYANKRTALYVTMIRTYSVGVVVIGVLLGYWLTYEVHCWQTAFTQEIYRLIIIDFIISIVGVFVAQMIRSKLYLTAWKKIGATRFDIARNTQNLIYNQTLFWIAFYFCPLLSVVIILKLIFTFYIKTYGVLNHCEPPSRSWRAAQTQTLFLALAFLSMVGAMFVIGYVITSVQTQNCGPFRGYDYTWQMVVEKVFKLQSNSTFWVIVTGLAKPGIGAGILIAMCVAVYYLRARAHARKEMVQILRKMLVLEAHDKEFLLNGISKVTEDQLMYHVNPLRTPRPSVLTNPQRENGSESPRFHHRYNELNSLASEPSASSSFHDNVNHRHGTQIELSERHSVSSDDSSIHNSVKSQDAKDDVVRRYNFSYEK